MIQKDEVTYFWININTMRTGLLFITFMVIAGSILFSRPVNPNPQGPHGGELMPASHYFIEFIQEPQTIKTYLLRRDMSAVSNKDISCEAELLQADGSLHNIELFPGEGDCFFSEASLKYASACKIIFNVRGKRISAKFQLNYQLVDHKPSN